MTPTRPDVQFTAREHEFVYSVAMKYMKDEERARDVTQDALLQAYLHRESFRGEARFRTWLYRIAATTALMHLRKERRRGPALPIDDDEPGASIELPDPGSSPEERSGAAEAVAIAGESLAQMGERYPQIFSMRFIEGYTESEIARRLHLRVATVKTRAYRARSRVRARLAQAIAPPPLANAA
jgi:RNA polymerase sigma-70 factor (ECF subfamily)